MFKIEGKTVHITRGDTGTLRISAKNSDNTSYTFQVGDVLRLNVFKKKDCGCVELTKDVTVATSGTTVDISLTSEDTTIGEVISKPSTYWYEVILNPETVEQTIIGYDLNGEKDFILYPEAKEGAE